MDDGEFLSYCNLHAETPRCGFVPAQLARLLRLASNDPKYEGAAKYWDSVVNNVIDCERDDIQGLVKMAREHRASPVRA